MENKLERNNNEEKDIQREMITRMESEEGKLKSELNDEVRQIIKDFLARVAMLEEIGITGGKFLAGYQQSLEFLRRPPINKSSKLIENIIEANETRRLKSYIKTGCNNNLDIVENMNKLRTCLLGLHDHLNEAKSILNELEHLINGLTGVIETANQCLSHHEIEEAFDYLLDPETVDQFLECYVADWPQSLSNCQEEKSSPQVLEDWMMDRAALMAVVYGMIKQDYVMQVKIINSLNLTTSSGEVESYCLMWSLRPFVNDEVLSMYGV